MVYDKDRIKRIIEYKDSLIDYAIYKDIEWLIDRYNEYYADSREYEQEKRQYKSVLNKYYNAEEEKESLKEQILCLKRKYKILKSESN